jgi:hypothetical protein
VPHDDFGRISARKEDNYFAVNRFADCFDLHERFGSDVAIGHWHHRRSDHRSHDHRRHHDGGANHHGKSDYRQPDDWNHRGPHHR